MLDRDLNSVSTIWDKNERSNTVLAPRSLIFLKYVVFLSSQNRRYKLLRATLKIQHLMTQRFPNNLYNVKNTFQLKKVQLNTFQIESDLKCMFDYNIQNKRLVQLSSSEQTYRLILPYQATVCSQIAASNHNRRQPIPYSRRLPEQ